MKLHLIVSRALVWKEFWVPLIAAVVGTLLIYYALLSDRLRAYSPQSWCIAGFISTVVATLTFCAILLGRMRPDELYEPSHGVPEYPETISFMPIYGPGLSPETTRQNYT